jgi:hypothetical protein
MLCTAKLSPIWGMTPMQGPCSAAASGFGASGFFAAGLAGEGLAGEGFVAEGFVAEGFVAEGFVAEGFVAEGFVAEGFVAEGLAGKGLAGKGLGAAVGAVCAKAGCASASANHKAMLWITFRSAASGGLEPQNCNRESVRVNRARAPNENSSVRTRLSDRARRNDSPSGRNPPT